MGKSKEEPLRLRNGVGDALAETIWAGRLPEQAQRHTEAWRMVCRRSSTVIAGGKGIVTIKHELMDAPLQESDLTWHSPNTLVNSPESVKAEYPEAVHCL